MMKPGTYETYAVIDVNKYTKDITCHIGRMWKTNSVNSFAIGCSIYNF